MADVNVKNCLRVWRRKYGEEKTARAQGNTYWRIPINNRRHLIAIFLRWMRALGITEERFRKSSFESELIDICFGTAPAFDEKKRKGGHEALKEELADILATEGIFSGRRLKNTKNAKSTPPTENLHNVKNLAEKAMDNAFSSAPPVFEEAKTLGREVNRALYKDVSNYEPVMDEEFAALIGVKKDE